LIKFDKRIMFHVKRVHHKAINNQKKENVSRGTSINKKENV